MMYPNMNKTCKPKEEAYKIADYMGAAIFLSFHYFDPSDFSRPLNPTRKTLSERFKKNNDI